MGSAPDVRPRAPPQPFRVRLLAPLCPLRGDGGTREGGPHGAGGRILTSGGREVSTYDDMRNFVVFRLPSDVWEEGDVLSSSLIADWIDENTTEGKPCVVIGETDFHYHYLIVGFSTRADALVLAEHLRSIPCVELAFDHARPPPKG